MTQRRPQPVEVKIHVYSGLGIGMFLSVLAWQIDSFSMMNGAGYVILTCMAQYMLMCLIPIAIDLRRRRHQ